MKDMTPDQEAMYGVILDEIEDEEVVLEDFRFDPVEPSYKDDTAALNARIRALEKVVEKQHRALNRLLSQHAQTRGAVNKHSHALNDVKADLQRKIDRRDI